MCQQPPGPHCAHQVKGTQPCLPFNLVAFQPHCWLPGTVAAPPAPRLGTLVSSGRSPAAFILICFSPGKQCGVLCSPNPCPGLGPLSPLLSALVRTGQYWGAERTVAGFRGT